MKNKTIIDGINVSKCSWCEFEPNTEPYCRINDGEDLNCKENSNCYFKQLARAKQKLKKIIKNCNETLSECSCKNPIIDVDCRECTSGGRVDKAKEILQIIEETQVLDIINKVNRVIKSRNLSEVE